MDINEAQAKFNKLYDEWKFVHVAARKLRSEVTVAFSDVAKGGKANPRLGILLILESMEQTEETIQKEIDKLLYSLD
jgi:hypothetical protein